MEPNHNNFAPPHELPEPQEVNGQNAANLPPASPEVRGANAPVSTSSASQQATDTALPATQQTPPTNIVDPATFAAPTPIADDADLIEKEWVHRAKAIVMQTKDDPHAQNSEMNKVKADYLKKRYNKDLKISEG